MKVSQNCVDLVKHFESLHDGDLTVIGLQPKMCPAGIWTVGYGRALRKGKGKFLKGKKDRAAAYAQFPSLTEEQAERMLAEDLITFSQAVGGILERWNVDLIQQQFDAVVSLCYNCGTGALEYKGKPRSVLRVLRAKEHQYIKETFGLWVKSGGKVLRGLVRRRRCEAHLFLTGEVKFE
jgi:lysozyme